MNKPTTTAYRLREAEAAMLKLGTGLGFVAKKDEQSITEALTTQLLNLPNIFRSK